MNTTHRIILGWLAVCIGIVVMVLGYGLWFLALGALTDFGLRYRLHPRIPKGRFITGPVLRAVLMVAFVIAIGTAAHSPAMSTRIFGLCIAGGISLYGLYEDLRVSRQAFDEGAG